MNGCWEDKGGPEVCQSPDSNISDVRTDQLQS